MKGNRLKKSALLFIILIFIAIISIKIYFLLNGFFLPPFQPSENSTTSVQIIENKEVVLILAGDIMLDRGVEYMINKEGDGNFKFPFLKIADELNDADIVFGNLEGPISDKGTKVGSIYSFRADPKAIESLTFSGFNILSVANNHAFDYGRDALEDTFLRLKNAEIDYVGGGLNATEAGAPIVKEINGSAGSPQVKIAFLAYTNLCPESWKATEENSGINCVSETDLENVKKEVANAKAESDILIVSLHAGEEYTQIITDFQKKFAQACVDSGADIVAGHHPHVVQKNEGYSSTSSEQVGYIFYSLGNFVFDQSFSTSTMQGQIVKVIIENKKIKEIFPIDIQINNKFQPETLQAIDK